MNASADPRTRRLKRRKPTHANASESESASTVSFGWTVTASSAKYPAAIAASVAARPSMLSSRLNAFVIPTSQITPSGTAIQSLATSSTVEPAPERDRRGAELRAELRPGGQRVQVVDEPCEKQQRAAAEDAPELRRWARAHRSRARRATPASSPAKIPRPPTSGVVLLVPAIVAGRGGEAAEDGEASATQITAYEAARAAIAASAITKAKGKGGLLARCVPWPT